MKTSTAGRIRNPSTALAIVVVLFAADWYHAQWVGLYYQGSQVAQAVAQTADDGFETGETAIWGAGAA